MLKLKNDIFILGLPMSGGILIANIIKSNPIILLYVYYINSFLNLIIFSIELEEESIQETYD